MTTSVHLLQTSNILVHASVNIHVLPEPCLSSGSTCSWAGAAPLRSTKAHPAKYRMLRAPLALRMANGFGGSSDSVTGLRPASVRGDDRLIVDNRARLDALLAFELGRIRDDTWLGADDDELDDSVLANLQLPTSTGGPTRASSSSDSQQSAPYERVRARALQHATSERRFDGRDGNGPATRWRRRNLLTRLRDIPDDLVATAVWELLKRCTVGELQFIKNTCDDRLRELGEAVSDP